MLTLTTKSLSRALFGLCWIQCQEMWNWGIHCHLLAIMKNKISRFSRCCLTFRQPLWCFTWQRQSAGACASVRWFGIWVSQCMHVCQSISPSCALIKRPSLPFPACLCSHSRPPSSSPRSPLAHGYVIVKNVFTKLALSQIKPHANQRLGERKREEGREGCV